MIPKYVRAANSDEVEYSRYVTSVGRGLTVRVRRTLNGAEIDKRPREQTTR